MKIYVVQYEYSYANNMLGTASPDNAGGAIAAYEDKLDAQACVEREEHSGNWGDFSDTEENDGWSTWGYILTVEELTVIPRSPFAVKSKVGDRFIIKIDGKAVLMQVDDLRYFEDDVWNCSPVEDVDLSQWPHQKKGGPSIYTDGEVQKRKTTDG